MNLWLNIAAWILLLIPVALMALTFAKEGLPHQFIAAVWKSADQGGDIDE